MGTYGFNANLLRNILLGVNVDLIELNPGILVRIRELFEDRRDYSARATPCRPKIDDGGCARADLYRVVISQRTRTTGRYRDYARFAGTPLMN